MNSVLSEFMPLATVMEHLSSAVHLPAHCIVFIAHLGVWVRDRNGVTKDKEREKS